LSLSRSNLYYTPVVNQYKIAIKEEIKSIFEEIPIVVREPLCLTQQNIAHPKYSYKLKGLDKSSVG